jgi:23S rRNA (cytosine1962-C5)-methyltransferase
LVAHGGRLVAINNAVYVSGADYMRTLQELCIDGHMHIEELVTVPADFAGMLPAPEAAWITDPVPFNHSTKIAVLRVLRKSSEAAREEGDAFLSLAHDQGGLGEFGSGPGYSR